MENIICIVLRGYGRGLYPAASLPSRQTRVATLVVHLVAVKWMGQIQLGYGCGLLGCSYATAYHLP
jgi:hypothetical protein